MDWSLISPWPEMPEGSDESPWEELRPGVLRRKVCNRENGATGYQFKWRCMDCLRPPEREDEFMVEDPLWSYIMGTRGGVICLTCFEFRLGRKVKCSELKDCPSNHLHLKGRL
jgi:hypothetical protein